MLRYQPPKSSIWGHSLRNMKPSTEWALASEFEKRAVARSGMGTSLLRISPLGPHDPSPSDLIQTFERALNKQSVRGFFQLTEPEFHVALEALVEREDTLPELPATISLSKFIQVLEWRIAGVAVPTSSTITWTFGTSPYVTTLLQFNERAEFDFIAAIFEELKICRLNEKHLKPIKGKQPKA